MTPHLTYANVVATVCLFLLLAGTTAVALNSGAFQNVDTLKTKARVKVNLGPAGEPAAKKLYDDGTFKLKGTCSTNGLPAIRAQVVLTSTRNHSSVDSDSDAEEDFGPGDVFTVAESSTNPQPVPFYSSSDISATAPNGRQLTGTLGAGSNMSDADCVFNLALLG
ncbi:MAG: hypothetical protein ACR2G3_02625 [Solirubrobacterales bacterium]